MEVEEGLERGTVGAFPPEDPHLQKKRGGRRCFESRIICQEINLDES